MDNSFIEFSQKLKPKGLLLINFKLPASRFSACTLVRYDIKDTNADVFASNISTSEGRYGFDVVTKSWSLDNIHLNMGGIHNIENAVAAITIAHHLNIAGEKIKKAIGNFKGVKRRFEYIIPAVNDVVNKGNNQIIFIDDYAHHPQELNALISGAKSMFNNRNCTIIFQPHLFSRTKDFAREFAESLDKADEILLLPIYPARELPIEGVSSNTILRLMKNKNARLITKEQLTDFIQNKFLTEEKYNAPGKLLITAGAGDIDQLVQPIKNILLKKV
jgi:UDP-N-acetylmuramate--alanine ligase